MASIMQEFYCHECVGYFRVKLNIERDYGVEICCPSCGHLHHRVIEDGVIKENGTKLKRHDNTPKEQIYPMKSSYSKEPITKKMKDSSQWGAKRDAVVVEKEVIKTAEEHKTWAESFSEAFRSMFFRDRWAERANDEKQGL